jgi:hypothetical protein
MLRVLGQLYTATTAIIGLSFPPDNCDSRFGFQIQNLTNENLKYSTRFETFLFSHFLTFFGTCYE